MGFKQEVLTKLEKIETKLSEQTVHMAVYNKELIEHTRRSTMLEERVTPLEQSHLFFNKLAKGITGILIAGAALASIAHYLLIKP